MLDPIAAASPGEAFLHPEVERRVRVRYPASFISLCQNDPAEVDDFWWLARVLDISTKGIGFLAGHPFELDALVVIEPTMPSVDFGTGLQARVIRCEGRLGEGWNIGCEFCTPLTDAQLRELVK